MTFSVEIVLKGREDAVTETLVLPAAEPPVWDAAFVQAILVEVLRALGRAQDPTLAADRQVILQGFSWIVEPVGGQVVVALEIPMGAAVAGPFDVDQRRLDELVGLVVQTERQRRSPQTIH